MKYPLTEDAKKYAFDLATAWNNGQIDQVSYLVNVTAGTAKRVELIYRLGVLDSSFELEPDLGKFLELGAYGLISITQIKDDLSPQYEVVLLQELRNAVENDFEVSEYFLTMNAVGMVVQGNVTMEPGSVLQNAAANTGNINQSVEQIADQLRSVLGDELMENDQDLRQAIVDLREATEDNKQSRIGKVVSELGRCLQHTANTSVIVNAITMLAPFLQRLA